MTTLFFIGLLFLITTPISFASISQTRSYNADPWPTVTPINWTPEATRTPGPPPTSTPAPFNPTLYISYWEGAPGSILTLIGHSFPPEEIAVISLNGQVLGQINTQYEFAFHLDTSGAEEGLYIIVAQTQTASDNEHFVLDANELVRLPHELPWAKDAPTFIVPNDCAFTHQLFLPMIVR